MRADPRELVRDERASLSIQQHTKPPNDPKGIAAGLSATLRRDDNVNSKCGNWKNRIVNPRLIILLILGICKIVFQMIGPNWGRFLGHKGHMAHLYRFPGGQRK